LSPLTAIGRAGGLFVSGYPSLWASNDIPGTQALQLFFTSAGNQGIMGRAILQAIGLETIPPSNWARRD